MDTDGNFCESKGLLGPLIQRHQQKMKKFLVNVYHMKLRQMAILVKQRSLLLLLKQRQQHMKREWMQKNL